MSLMSHDTEFDSDTAFQHAVSDLLEALLERVDEIDADLDVQLTPGNLRVVFEDTDETFILSQQTPTHELWLSANLTAWHFRRHEGAWRERDSGEPMLDLLGRLFSEKVDEDVVFDV